MKENRSVLPARLDARGVKSAYQRIAPFYDLWGKLTESRAHDLCLRWLDLAEAERILDVATGTGALLGKIVGAAPRVVTAIGADLTPAMLTRAAVRRHKSGMAYRLIQADARRLPIRSGTIDLLINAYMFDLLPQGDFGPVLREFSRVLSPHGRLALINMTLAERFSERIWETLYRIRPSLMGGCRGVQMAEPLAQAGFVVRRRARVSQLAFPSEVVLASRTVRAEHAVDL